MFGSDYLGQILDKTPPSTNMHLTMSPFPTTRTVAQIKPSQSQGCGRLNWEIIDQEKVGDASSVV